MQKNPEFLEFLLRGVTEFSKTKEPRSITKSVLSFCDEAFHLAVKQKTILLQEIAIDFPSRSEHILVFI